MQPRDIERTFPRLSNAGYQITSPVDPSYNCVAWAAGRSDEWWWPACPFDLGYYWPSDAPDDLRLTTFIGVFESLGFTCCDDGTIEAAFVKIAIYEKNDQVMHASRQLPDGRWTSKLGPQQDIAHAIDALEGGEPYGSISQFMRRSDSLEEQ